METLRIIVQDSESGTRLDKYIAQICDISRTLAQQWIENGNVLLSEKKVTKSYIVANGNHFSITVPEPELLEVLPQNIPLNIVFEDEHLLVVNKPKGMVVHPAPGNPDNTLVNAILFHCNGSLSGIGGKIRPGIVHRIDKDTSGLLVVAKDDFTHQVLSEQFAVHSITRIYHAVVYGGVKQDVGEVDTPIGRDKNDRKKMAVTQKNSKNACTKYTVLEKFDGFSHVSLQLTTGRTHQIRVHMASIGHPVAGDAIYGPRKVITELHGQCLHAKTLGFIHPVTKKFLLFNSDLPPYFSSFLEKIGKNK